MHRSEMAAATHKLPKKPSSLFKKLSARRHGKYKSRAGGSHFLDAMQSYAEEPGKDVDWGQIPMGPLSSAIKKCAESTMVRLGGAKQKFALPQGLGQAAEEGEGGGYTLSQSGAETTWTASLAEEPPGVLIRALKIGFKVCRHRLAYFLFFWVWGVV